MDLTPEERALLAPLEIRFFTWAGSTRTFDAAAAEWEGIAEEVGGGYRGDVDDYTNDLTARDRLEEVIRAVPAPLGRTLAARVAPADARFERATRPDERDLLATFHRHGAGWWWRRLPLVVPDLLARTLF